MNILFLSLYTFNSIEEHAIYPDLLREFIKDKNRVVVINPIEKIDKNTKTVIKGRYYRIINCATGRITKTNIVEKGINTVLIENRITNAIRRYCRKIHFDLVIYPTPPVTFSGLVKYVKKRDNAQTYLLLKDIFPQNAIDIGMMQKDGVKGILYKYFRKKEKELYRISDYIGCMSDANVRYLLSHNPELDKSKVEVCPNAVEPVDMSADERTRIELRKKYNIPQDKRVFFYGGNLGKPQDIPFIIECLRKAEDDDKLENVFFLIVGGGTEYHVLDDYIRNAKPKRVKLLQSLPKEDYDRLAASCDIGLIFLDYRFTIPNFPSRLLAYMQAKLPVFAVTDRNTDISKVIDNNRFGWWCGSDDANAVVRQIEDINSESDEELKEKGNKAWNCLLDKFDVKDAYKTILKHMNKRKKDNVSI